MHVVCLYYFGLLLLLLLRRHMWRVAMQCNGISYVRRCCHDDFTRLHAVCLCMERDVMWIWFNWKLSRMENTPLRHSQPTNIRKIIFIVRLLLSVCVHSLWEKKIQIDWFPFEKRCIIADNSTFIVWNSIWNFFFFFFVNYGLIPKTEEKNRRSANELHTWFNIDEYFHE